MPVNSESWSITATLSSASAVSVRCWACLDPRSTSGPHRCANQRCGSWRGSTLSTWRIPAVEAAGWCTTWARRGSRSAETVCETSCAAWVYGPSTRSLEPRCMDSHRRGFPAWWIQSRSPQSIRSGQPTSPTFRSRKDFCTWWRSWISTPGTCSAGSSPTALTRSSVSMPWRWPWPVVASPRSSTPTKAASSPPSTLWRSCRSRRSRSAGQGESAATTTFWWRGCGGRSSMRRCTCAPTAMAGRLKSAWPASSGGTAM